MDSGTGILIVEDSPTQAEQLKHLLEENGYRVSVSQNGEDALAALKENGPSIVISDVVMPKMNGYEMCHAIKSDRALGHVTVILLTYLSDPEDIILGLQSGADSYITKPYQESYLLSCIGFLLENPFIEGPDDPENAAQNDALTTRSRYDRRELEITYAGKRHTIAAGRQQMLSMLLSVYESAVHQNRELSETQRDLQKLNDQLEDRVEDRTAELRDTNVRLIQEIVEHRQTEQILEDQQARAMQADRLRSLGEMAAGVAHELNQPLSGIRAYAEGTIYGMKRGWDTSEEDLRETLGSIVEQVDRMTEIIDHMRTFSRDRSEEDSTPFEIGSSIENALNLVGAQLAVHGIRVDVDVTEGLPVCEGWSHQIEQVVLNLITNARDAMDEHAERMKAGEAPPDPDWKPVLGVRARRDGELQRIRIVISDTGGGIPEDILPRIFDPFYTSKEVGKGTGLGLAISRSVMDRHGGTLEVENRPGVGAGFSMILPARIEEHVS